MYVPPHFLEIDTDEIKAITQAAPLACIVAQTAEGLIANHIPLLSAPDGRLIGHVAAANDMHRLIRYNTVHLLRITASLTQLF
ncbi:MAG: FMN-binding negative transcriptional regulator [Paracoccaceae bacterium]|nr:FMN-binding negative transcriptional regulator [Paracoccaceae bacterium]